MGTPKAQHSVAERFWSLAADQLGEDEAAQPEEVVRHVLAILDALDRGEGDTDLPRETAEFLELLRKAEAAGVKSYAAPERIGGESLDERSLVFSIGVFLFERLTGRHPFGAEGNEPRRLARMSRGEFGSGVNYFPQVPASLRAILMRAMGPFPEERFASLEELRAQLEKFARQEVREPAHPVLPDTRKRRPRFDRQPTAPGDLAPHIEKEQEIAARRRETESAATVSGETGAGTRWWRRVPVAWLAVGVAIGALAVYLIGPRRGGEAGKESAGEVATAAETEAATASPPAAVSPPAPAPAPAAETGTGTGTEAAAEAETETASEKPVRSAIDAGSAPVAAGAVDAGAAPAEEFDALESARVALEQTRNCFADLQKPRPFGITLLYSTSAISRAYYAPGTTELSYAEKRCLTAALVGTLPVSLPPRTIMVEYQVRMGATDMQVKVTRAKLK